jgi:hypothetical protein
MLSLFRLRAPSLKSALFSGATVVAIMGVAYWAFEHSFFEPRIVRRGQISLIEGRDRITVPTRLLDLGRRSLWQFEVSPGVWKDCGYDCEKALRRALAE